MSCSASSMRTTRGTSIASSRTSATTSSCIRLPSLDPSLAGKAAFAQFYASQRFNLSRLRAELVNRIVLGSKVIDHERIFGVRDTPFELVVAHIVRNAIERMRALTPD